MTGKAFLSWSGKIQHLETALDNEKTTSDDVTQVTVHDLLPSLRPLARICPRMRSQAAGPGNQFSAQTFSRSLPQMCPHVHSHVAGPRERLAARLENIWPLPPYVSGCSQPGCRTRQREREIFIDNLLVRVRLIIEMSRPALRHVSLNSLFQVALYLPS